MDSLLGLLANPEEADIATVEKTSERLVSDWSYAAGTSNHGQLALLSKTIAKLFNVATENPKLQPPALKVAQAILKDHLRVIYRSLFIFRTKQTLAALDLLEGLARTANGAVATELYNSFDFTLKIIPKILASEEFRPAFLRFYMSFIQNVAPMIRRDLFAQKKIVSAWLNRLHQDPDDVVLASLTCLESYLVKDGSVSKSTKISFFNDAVLAHLVRLYSRLGDISKRASYFFSLLFLDREYGISFVSNSFYGPPNNKQALALLKLLRPWESLPQMDFSVDLLQHLNELIPPYFEYLQSRYPFTPKLTMFWFSYAVLHVRTVRLEIPDLDSLQEPDAALLGASVLPQSLTKSHLHAAMTFKESSLVRFQSAQIILHSLIKLESVIGIYKSRQWDPTPIFREVLSRIPDVHVFLKEADPQLLQTAVLACAKQYYRVMAAMESIIGVQSLPSMPSLLNATLDIADVQGLSLVQALNVLEIQTFTAAQMKWWNPVKGDLSFFTKLVRFAVLNSTLATASADLLELLAAPTLLVQDVTAARPLNALIYSLEVLMPQFTAESRAVLWKLLDEAVSRCVRLPYGYIDRFKTLVSPLIVSLVEQLAFVEDAHKASVSRWVYSFARDLGVIGEDSTAISQLVLDVGDVDRSLPLDDYFEFVLTVPASDIMNRNDIIFKISNPLEFMATIYRATHESSQNLVDFLFKNLPADLASLLDSGSCIKMALEAPREVVSSYLAAVRYHEVESQGLGDALDGSEFWDLGVDFISTDSLLSRLSDSDQVSKKVVLELTNRGVAVPLEMAPKVLGYPDQLKLLKLSSDDAKRLLRVTADVQAIAAIIQASSYYDSSLPKDLRVLLAASIYAPEAMEEQEVKLAVELALQNINRDSVDALKVLKVHVRTLSEGQMAQVSEFISQTKSPLMPELVTLAESLAGLDDGVQLWHKRVVLRLTKVFAELSEFSSVMPFVTVYRELLESMGIWRVVSSNSLNALISIILAKAGQNQESLALCCTLAFSAPADRIQHTQHLQAVLAAKTAEALPQVTLLQSILIWKLFSFDVVANSTPAIRRTILSRFGGAVSATDSLLLEVLRSIEAETSRSWAEDIETVVVQGPSSATDDYETPKLVTVTGERLHIILEEERISALIHNYDPSTAMTPPKTTESFLAVLGLLENYDVVHSSRGYNEEFLLNLMFSTDHIFSNGKIDVRALVDSKLLPFVITSLGSANSDVSRPAHNFLVAVASTLSLEEKSHKDQVAIALVVNKLLFFLAKKERERCPAYLAVLVAAIAEVVLNPGHFLHEKISNWLLAGPSIQDFEIPLFKDIQSSIADAKPREIIWFLESVRAALVDVDSVNAFIKQGVFEWALALTTLLTPKTRQLERVIESVLAKVPTAGGSLALIKRSGGLSCSSDEVRLIASTTNEDLTRWMNI